MRHKTYLKVIDAIKAGINSKRGIQDHSGLSWGSCSPVINNLLSQEVIVNQNSAKNQKGGKGRKTRYFHFNRTKYLLMGMEIDTYHINCCVTTMGNERVGSYSTEFNEAMSSANISENITKAFAQCKEQLELDPENIYCISFSIPGAVDVNRKIWQYCERVPEITDVEFDRIAGKGILPAGFYMQHNIHAHAYSAIPLEEIEKRDYVFIHVGQGMAMSANMGEILYGHRGFAGEIGHIPFPSWQKDIICLCGKKNCLEAILNKDRILEYVKRKFKVKASSLKEIEDKQIKQQVAKGYILRPLVFAATIVSNIFDPNRLIIEGNVLEPFYPYLKEAFESELRHSAWLSGPSDITWCETGKTDGCYGAILHSSARIINDFISQIDLDH